MESNMFEIAQEKSLNIIFFCQATQNKGSYLLNFLKYVQDKANNIVRCFFIRTCFKESF